MLRALLFVFCAAALAACDDKKTPPPASDGHAAKTERTAPAQLSVNEQLAAALDNLSKKRLDCVETIAKTTRVHDTLLKEKTELDARLKKLSDELDALRDTYKNAAAWPVRFGDAEYSQEGFKHLVVVKNKLKKQVDDRRARAAKDLENYKQVLQKLNLSLSVLDSQEETIRLVIQDNKRKKDLKNIAKILEGIQTDYGVALEQVNPQSITDTVQTGVPAGTVSDKEFEDAMKN